MLSDPRFLTIVILAATAAAYFLGVFIGRQLKMKSHGWKIGLILASLTMAGLVIAFVPPKAGIDLRGGVILVYEVDAQRTAEIGELQGEGGGGDEALQLDTLVSALNRRINPGGQKEVVIRKYGTRQVEVIIPEVEDAEIARVKKLIQDTGFLRFRIIAHPQRHARSWSAGEEALQSDDAEVRTGRFVRDEGEIVGEWITIGRVNADDPESPLRFPVDERTMLIRELTPGQIEVLTDVNVDRDVQGRHLKSVRSSFDDNGHPCVSFTMTAEGAVLFGQLTSENRPDEQAGITSRLGIVLDDTMLSAPEIEETISSQGIIRGSFTQAEVEDLVTILRAGKLPAVLQPEPIAESRISPLLGEDTIRKGTIAIGASLAVVLVFMAVYYRFAGLVACLALLANLVLIFGLMFLVKAAFTLPGIAGLVLTVGMSVDANVLIYERMREELARGATLRMAIRNGFARATTTIMDANITTLISGVILYALGNEQIRGFAITLILGLLMSLYTAVFCSRVMFDIAERRGWIKNLYMMQIVGKTNIRFLSYWRIATVASLIFIAVGLVAAAQRGRDLLDIDFNGGTSVLVMLNQPTPIADVRERLSEIADSVAVTQVNPEGREPDTVYKIDTSIREKEDLQTLVRDALSDESGRTLLVTRSMEFEPVSLPKVEEPEGQSRRAAPLSAEPILLAYAQDAAEAVQGAVQAEPTAQTEPGATTDLELTESDLQTTTAPSTPSTEATPRDQQDVDENSASGVADADDEQFRSAFQLAFDERIGAEALEDSLLAAAEKLGIDVRLRPTHPEWDGHSERGFKEWTVAFSTDQADSEKVLGELQSQLSQTPIWLSANNIGSQVAGDMRTRAIVALVLSMLGIMAYVWVRFQRVSYGVAGVAALVHDVLVTFAAVAMSYWVALAGGFLMIDEFKISLTMVAAFLTIIGYSTNDTIVIFDRIREIKGKSPDVTEEMINTSVNETLSRTIITSLSTLLVVIVLYIWGGEGIHGFAFAMIVGLIAGTFSTVFIAPPLLLRMQKRSEGNKQTTKSGKRVPAGAGG